MRTFIADTPGVTQRRAAELAGISEANMSRILAGKQGVRRVIAKRVAEAFTKLGCPIKASELMAEEPEHAAA